MARRVTPPPSALTPPLASRTARIVLAAFVVLHLALAVTGPPGGPTWRDAVALVLLSGAAGVVVLAAGEPLPPARTAAVVLAVLAGAGLVTAELPPTGWPGYAAWHLGAATFVLLGLTLRRRTGAAWAGMAGLVAECVLWSAAGGQGVAHRLDLVDRQAGTLLIGTLFAVGLRRAARSVARFRAAERVREAEQQRLATVERERRGEAARVLDLAAPTLRRVAAGRALTEAERAEIRALEGRLRDRIVAPQLEQEDLAAAAAAARRRGIDVVLLTDLDRRHPRTTDALSWLAGRIREARGPAVTGRVVTRAGTLRVSAVDGDRHEERIFGEPPEQP